MNEIYLNLSNKLFNFYKKIPISRHYNINNSTIVKNIYMETNASTYGFFDNLINFVQKILAPFDLFQEQTI